MYIFGTDFDDTLYFHDKGGIREQDMEAIRRFQKAGHKFGLVSGRARVMRELIEKMTEGKVDFDFWIYSNGAQICDKDNNVLQSHYLPESFVREVVEKMPDAGFILHAEDTLYMTPAKDKRLDYPATIVHSCDEFDPSRIFAVSFDFETLVGKQVFEENKDRKDVILVPNSRYADFNPLGVTKGDSLNELVDLLEGDNTSAAIGDSFNDLSMLEKADISFTFPTSPEEVRSAATHLVDGVDQAVDLLLDDEKEQNSQS